MSSIVIRAGDFDAFFEAPFRCYGKAAFIPCPLRHEFRRSLDESRNPLFARFARRELLTAHRDGAVVGRILAHIHDASNHRHGLRRGYFGLLDCIDDEDVARALTDAASRWLRERNCDEIAGSFNLTITQMIGVVTGGFEHRPYTYQDWSPPHIGRLLVQCGFEAFYPMRTFEVPLAQTNADALLGERAALLQESPDWHFSHATRRDLESQLKAACQILNDAFAENDLFVPLTEEEFLFPCEGLTAVLDERLSWFAHYRGEPVGVFLCIPDLNPFLHATGYRLKLSTPWHLLRSRMTRTRAAVVFYAVRRAYHGKGVNSVLLHRSVKAMQAAGYTHLGVSWVSDRNLASLKQLEKLGARPLHRLHLFRKRLP